MREVISRQNDLFDEVEIGFASCPADLQVVFKEDPVIPEPTLLSEGSQFRDHVLVAYLFHVLIQISVKG